MADIVLKDRLGEQQTYEGVQHVKLNKADGGFQIFTAGEPEEKTVELDFSVGSMEVAPGDGKLLSKVVIPVPVNLTPANIAKDVDVAGVVGTLEGGGGGGAKPCVFLCMSTKTTRNTGSTSSFTISGSCDLPLSSNILDIHVLGDSTSSYDSTMPPTVTLDRQYLDDRYPLEISETTTFRKVKWSKTVTPISTSTVYKYLVTLLVTFEIPGFEIHKNGDVVTLYADKNADINVLRSTYRSVENVSMLDFSSVEKSTSVYPNAFRYYTNLKQVIFPPNLNYVALEAFYHCSSLTSVIFTGNVNAIQTNAFRLVAAESCTFDFRNCTQVPTLAASYSFNGITNLQILVPSALYDAWITATNWSTLADKIVAV